TLTMALFILVAGVVGSFIVGRPLSASTAGVAAAVAGFVNGAGVVMSLLLGFGIFFLLITSIAQLILRLQWLYLFLLLGLWDHLLLVDHLARQQQELRQR
ncbi:hypothetical protein Q2T49_34320, partial [Pseudomonas aeruginosa]|uniref:hypothetical protein n=1 Tax=Pseudomonas aeruginosa TaxID=287 RepID=UPI00265EEE3B